MEIRHCRNADPAGLLCKPGVRGGALVAVGGATAHLGQLEGAEGTRGLANSWWEEEVAFS